MWLDGHCNPFLLVTLEHHVSSVKDHCNLDPLVPLKGLC
jgi:hypothetical protein